MQGEGLPLLCHHRMPLTGNEQEKASQDSPRRQQPCMTDARETLLGEVSRDGLALWNASEEMKGDRQIVMTAVSQNGNARVYATEEMKGDREIVMTAVCPRHGNRPAVYATEEMKGDREVLMTVLSQNGCSLKYLSEEMKSNHEVVMAAVSQNGRAPGIRHRRYEG